jgi:hypothetical protein
MNFFSPRHFCPAMLLLVAVASCGRDGVKVYHVDNSDAANSAPSAVMPATMPDVLPAPDNSGQPQLQYVLPDGWEKKVPTTMRVASFGISENGKTADVSVIPLVGMAGGDLANVTRWRGQIGLPPMTEEELPKLIENVQVAGQPGKLFDVAGASQRILVAVLQRDDTAWFFKIIGDADLVETQKPAFISFLKTVQFVAPTATPAMDLNQLPPSHPPIEGTSLGTQNSLFPNANGTVTGGMVNDKPARTIPTGWFEAPAGQFLLAKFSITSADGAAAVNVSSLAGDGGGLLANVNRWRGQLSLPPVTQEDEFSKMVGAIDSASGKIQTVDFTGTDAQNGKPTRLIGAVIPQNGQTWFYKLMGDPNIVAQQKDAFIKFVQSAKYPDAH